MNHEEDEVPPPKRMREIERDNRDPQVEFYVGSETMAKVYNAIAKETSRDGASRIISELQHQGVYFREVRMAL